MPDAYACHCVESLALWEGRRLEPLVSGQLVHRQHPASSSKEGGTLPAVRSLVLGVGVSGCSLPGLTPSFCFSACPKCCYSVCGPCQHPDSNPCLCVVFLHNVRPPLELFTAGIGLYPKEVEVLSEDPDLILELARVDG